MHKLALAVVIAVLVAAAGCQKSPSNAPEKTEAANATPAKDGAAAKPATDTTAKPATPAPGDIPAPPDVAAPPADAEKTASGLAFKILEKGKGTDKPGPNDSVSVNYTGWTTDGKMFDSSTKRGQPAT